MTETHLYSGPAAYEPALCGHLLLVAGNGGPLEPFQYVRYHEIHQPANGIGRMAGHKEFCETCLERLPLALLADTSLA